MPTLLPVALLGRWILRRRRVDLNIKLGKTSKIHEAIEGFGAGRCFLRGRGWRWTVSLLDAGKRVLYEAAGK